MAEFMNPTVTTPEYEVLHVRQPLVVTKNEWVEADENFVVVLSLEGGNTTIEFTCVGDIAAKFPVGAPFDSDIGLTRDV